jgi:hypothetical protein
MTSKHAHLRSVGTALGLLVTALALPVTAVTAASTATVRFATLDGAQVGAAGDTDGSGSFSLHFGANGKKLCWALTVRDIDKPTAIRVHKGPVGASGPVVLGFKVLPAAGDLGAAAGCVPAADPVLDALRADATQFYIAVSTKASPDGAIRGQLR